MTEMNAAGSLTLKTKTRRSLRPAGHFLNLSKRSFFCLIFSAQPISK